MSNQNFIPPKLARRFLLWFLRHDLAEEVEGDLEEQFLLRSRQGSIFRARLGYWYEVLRYLRPFALKKTTISGLFSYGLFQHNTVLAYRNFRRHKGSFIINLTGLSTGLACVLLIYLWVADEMSVDKFHKKDSQIYQVMQIVKNADDIRTIEYTQGLLARALAEEMPEVETAVSVIPSSWFDNTGIISYQDDQIKARGQYVSRDYFEVFSYDLIKGDKKQLFRDVHNVTISKELAIKLFHSAEEAVGKMVNWNHETLPGQYVVAGIFNSPPQNATEQFDVVFNYELFFQNRPGLQSWGNSDPYTYVLLKKETDVSHFNDKIADFLRTKENAHTSQLFIRKYSDKYLYNHFENGIQAGGRIAYVRLFSIIAIFILVIACINFMNLSTAKSAQRLKEVGVKKVVGAGKHTLIFQYLNESFWITFLSFLTAMMVVLIFLPQFNTITGKHLSLHLNSDLMLWAVALLLFTSLIAGSYPAFYVSGFNPIKVLKGHLKSSIAEMWTRRGLVVFQFSISIILIVVVIVIYQQIAYIQTKNLGYDRDNILCFEMEMRFEEDENFLAPGGAWEKRMETFLNEITDIPGVVTASNSFHDLTGNHGGLSGIDWEAGDQDEKVNFGNLEVGYEFIETLGIEMAEGRTFSKKFGSERSKIILNQAAIEIMGLSDPVGKTIRVWGQDKEIIGVAGDFHYESLYEQVQPCLFQLEPRSSNILAKVRAGTEKITIDQIKEVYNRYNPGLVFDYQFLDSDYQTLYADEQRVSSLSKYFAGLAIVISCLGLFGLATFSVQKRLKEIGIRKVLGSGRIGIVRLLSDDFTRILVIAISIAIPISYLIANRWLDNFAYHVNLKWWYFAAAGSIALLMSWITIGIHTFSAARINPVQCLKEE